VIWNVHRYSYDPAEEPARPRVFRVPPEVAVLRWRYCQTVRGDRVEIVIDAGDDVRTYQVVATRNGRRVEINTGRGVVEVMEVTRGGTPVRTARFMANRILALVEHPATDRNIAEEVIDPGGAS
jgi:hypothetical protein